MDDYNITPCGRLGGKLDISQGGRFLIELSDMYKALSWIKLHMEGQQYWPSVYWTSDHGNTWEIDLEGNEIYGNAG
jgi:hypothetical protein